MWNVIEDGELKPLPLLNVAAECSQLLENHDTTHHFCDEYGCQCILEIKRLADGP
jgi:hypothetical protein